MTTRISILVALLASMLAFGVSSAYASLSDEVNSGRAIAARVDAGTATCKTLSTTDFEHLGEYVMERMVGSRSAHETMNSRMEAMIGAGNADRMHQALGRRYAGCATSATGSGMMGGGGMMGGASTGGGWGAMMRSDLSWMRNGSWQHMTRAGWQNAASRMMGSGMMNTGASGWSTGAVIGVVLGALLLGGLAVYAACASHGATILPSRRPLNQPRRHLTPTLEFARFREHERRSVGVRCGFVRRSQRGIRTVPRALDVSYSVSCTQSGNVPREKPGASASVARHSEIAPQRNQAPDRLNKPESPRSSKEPVGAGQRAPRRECQDNTSVTPLDGVHQHHESDGNGTNAVSTLLSVTGPPRASLRCL